MSGQNDDDQGDDPQPEQDLNREEQVMLEDLMKQATDLGIDLTDPKVKAMIKALGNVEGEINAEKIDEIMDEQELEANVRTSEVIVDGIDEATYPAMLNTRIQGDGESLKRLLNKTTEELKIMLTEAMARDIPAPAPGASQHEQEEAILNAILDNYGTFTLKRPKVDEKRATFWTWMRNWGFPGLCLLMVVLYTAFMYYHYPESYTDPAAFELKQRARQSRKAMGEGRDEL